VNELRTLYRYRQLIATLTARDLKARYRGSILGFFWSLANPLLLLAVYTLVFTKFFPQQVVQPYPLFPLDDYFHGPSRLVPASSPVSHRETPVHPRLPFIGKTA